MFLGVICENPATWLQQTITNILTDFLSGLARDFGDAIIGFINDVNFLTRTPENLSYNNDLVKHYATATQVLADGLLAVVVLVSGYNVMLRPYMGATYAGALEFLPRLLLGGILINTAAWWGRLAIDVNNAACGVFGAPSIADVVSNVLRVAVDHTAGLLMLLVATVMAILLLIQQLMRLALVDVLLILAPLAALLWILPQSQAWGRLWGRLFVATVVSQAVQVLTLRLGFNLATDLPQLSAAGVLQPLLGIATPRAGAQDPEPAGRWRGRRQHRDESGRDCGRGGRRLGRRGGSAGRARRGHARRRRAAMTGPDTSGDLLGGGLGRVAVAICIFAGVVLLVPIGLASVGFGAILGVVGGVGDPAAPAGPAGRVGVDPTNSTTGLQPVPVFRSPLQEIPAASRGLIAGWADRGPLNQFARSNYRSDQSWRTWRAADCSAAALDWLLGAYGQQLGALDESIALIGPGGGISPSLGLLDARGPALARALAARGLAPRQPRESNGQPRPLASVAELQAWLSH
ncbi:MAG TPA: conjugal transfer protein TrbL family protein, partial [Roseiflexaceae bacterium]